MSVLHRPNLLKLSIPRSAWLDAMFLTIVLLAINSFVHPSDIGWRKLHPSPFFILPILLGCRYGFASGILAGIWASVVVMAGAAFASGNTPQSDIISKEGYLLGSLIIVGGICGELQSAFRRKELRTAAVNTHLQGRLKKLTTDLFFLREAKAELERMIATRDSEVATLDSELRRLADSEGDDIYYHLLLLLNRQARLSEAAIYIRQNNNSYARKSLLGGDKLYPKNLVPEQIEMVSLAVNRKSTVTIPEFWQKSDSNNGDYLIAVPFLDAQEEVLGFLLVSGIPFIALTKKTVNLVTLICRWASQIIDLREKAPGSYRISAETGNQKVHTSATFQQHLELAFSSFCLHNLPSSAVIFRLQQPRKQQKQLDAVILPQVRNTDLVADMDGPLANLVVLLPMTGERGVNIFLQRIEQSIKKSHEAGIPVETEVFSFDSQITFEELWKKMNSYVANS